MKRKTIYLATLALFAFVALLFGVYRYTRALFPGAPRAARTVIPRGSDAAELDSNQLGDERAYDETKSAPVIPLTPEESFIQALSVDLNRDGQVDQVIALKRAAEPNVYLVAAIHNPLTGQPSESPRSRPASPRYEPSPSTPWTSSATDRTPSSTRG